MSSFGQTLRQAREAKGLTCSQVASQTRILVQIVEEMENEDFHRIAAPIYGRGFVRLFAECVDLDPQPLIREFMDIYEGRRAPTVLVRDVPTPKHPLPQPPPPPVEEEAPIPAMVPQMESNPEPWQMAQEIPVASSTQAPMPDEAPIPSEDTMPPLPSSVPPAEEDIPTPPQPIIEREPEPIEPIPVPEPPPSVRGLDLFDPAARTPTAETFSDTFLPSGSDLFPAREASPETPTKAPLSDPSNPKQYDSSAFLPSSFEESESGPSAAERFRRSLSSVSHGVVQTMRRIPRSTWRIAILVVGAILVVSFIVYVCTKLYQATSETATEEPNQVESAAETTTNSPSATEQTDSSTKPGATTAKSQPKTPPSSTRVNTPTKGASKLQSTGQTVPPLYVD